jgi:hypothetical protein
LPLPEPSERPQFLHPDSGQKKLLTRQQRRGSVAYCLLRAHENLPHALSAGFFSTLVDRRLDPLFHAPMIKEVIESMKNLASVIPVSRQCPKWLRLGDEA